MASLRTQPPLTKGRPLRAPDGLFGLVAAPSQPHGKPTALSARSLCGAFTTAGFLQATDPLLTAQLLLSGPAPAKPQRNTCVSRAKEEGAQECCFGLAPHSKQGRSATPGESSLQILCIYLFIKSTAHPHLPTFNLHLF